MKLVHEDRFLRLQPQGRLDSHAGIRIKQQILDIEPDQFELCIVDLAEVDFIDSSGLLALATGLNAARRKKCRLVICNPRPSVKLIFEITQLDSVFEFFNTYSEDRGATAETEQATPMKPQPIAA
ncbi:STAS domain-containing protein [Leptothermofonsia sichuanensis]|uniref:STAS domain-containing protein n=1 Tax=Leptothermofonsia sichuanensis TaxID=2917832 RepID=UPI001CEC1661|nr:STAS domain-containing protein [Leptothermofonsia sichuanensis]